MDIDKLIAPPGKIISLKHYSSSYVGEYDKKTSIRILKENRKELAEIQNIFWADNRHSLLIVLQAPDSAGKDGAIKHVMKGINPQGCKVSSFKVPSSKEINHTFLWRHYKALPEKGQIGIFNRSHYENVLVTKVNPQFILKEKLPGIDSVDKVNDEFWARRYRQINDFEREISENGTQVLKFFLNLSKEEQKKRLLDRLENSDKNWKFSSADIRERAFWEKYQLAYQDMLSNTSTSYAPWYIIPADNKWFSRMAIGEIIVQKMRSLDLQYPKAESPEKLVAAKKILQEEN